MNETGKGCYLSYWHDDYAVPIEPHFATWNYNPFPRAWRIAAVKEGKSSWLTSSLSSWYDLVYIVGFSYLRDTDGQLGSPLSPIWPIS